MILLVKQQLFAQIKQDNYLALEKALGPESFFNGHLTGFMLYDLDSQHVEFEKNSQIRILPASTTKLFTLFASLVILQDSTQTIRYVSAGDTLKIWGSGDPTWKYKEFAQPDFQKILGNYSVIQFSDAKNYPGFFDATVCNGVLHCDRSGNGPNGEPPIRVLGWQREEVPT